MIALAAVMAACDSTPECSAERLGPPSLEEAFGEVPSGPVRITLETGRGTISCEVDPQRAPRGVATLVGLAEGRACYRDVRTRLIRRGHFYDGLVFHRRVDGALVQSGCPIGDGTGTPGFRYPIELSTEDEAIVSEPGALLLATYTPPPGREDPNPPPEGHVHGSQFVIALRPMTHVLGSATVLGKCENLDVVRAIAAAQDAASLRSIRVPR